MNEKFFPVIEGKMTSYVRRKGYLTLNKLLKRKRKEGNKKGFKINVGVYFQENCSGCGTTVCLYNNSPLKNTTMIS